MNTILLLPAFLMLMTVAVGVWALLRSRHIRVPGQLREAGPVHAFQITAREGSSRRVLTVGPHALSMPDRDLAAALSRELDVPAEEARDVLGKLRQRVNAAQNDDGAGPAAGEPEGLEEKPLGAAIFYFDRRLAPAAASEARPGAQESTVSTDGSLTLRLTSVSKREIELLVWADAGLENQLAVIRVQQQLTPETYLVPLTTDSSQVRPDRRSGSVLIQTPASALRMDRAAEIVGVTELDHVPPSHISRSVRAAVGATREWWQSLAADHGRGKDGLEDITITTVQEALTMQGAWE